MTNRQGRSKNRLKEEILAILRARTNDFISSAELRSTLGCFEGIEWARFTNALQDIYTSEILKHDITGVKGHYFINRSKLPVDNPNRKA